MASKSSFAIPLRGTLPRLSTKQALVRVAAAGDIHCSPDRREEIEASFALVSEEADIVLLAGDEKADTRIRVLGAPAGYDFMSLVDAILVVSDASEQRLSAETEQKLAALTEPIIVQVFVTPT